MGGKRILIVEDENVVAEQLRQSLTAQGYEVVGIASSGEQAVTEGGSTRPDLIVMDIVLSGSMDGIAAAQQLRPLGIPLIYLTGYSDQHLLDRAHDTQPSSYVLKPARAGELGAAIQLAFSRQKQEQDRIKASHEADDRFRLMVADVTDVAIFTLDITGRVDTWNRGAERINGYSSSEILGHPHALLFTDEDREGGVPQAELALAERNGSADNTRWLKRPNGERFWADGVLTAIRNRAGVLTGFTKVIRDGTKQKYMEDSLRKTEEQLRVALHAARMGTWDWNIQTNTETFDDGLRALFGLRPEQEVKTIEDFYALIHPEDREKVKAAFDQTRIEGIHLDTEFRVNRPDGTQRWLVDQGEVLLDRYGRPERLTGACVDITERKHAAEALQRSEERFRLFVNNVRDYALFQMDGDGIIVSWNSGAERLLGYSEEEIIGQPGALLFVPEDVARGEHVREMATAATLGRAEDERWHLRKDGTRFWCSGVMAGMHDDEGRLHGFAKVMRDETQRRVSNEQLKSSLNEKEVLLKEVYHRVKNNLQVITSLLSLQSGSVESDTVRRMFEEACNRVRSIGDIHELLYRSPDLAHVAFDTYLERLAKHLLLFYGMDSDHIRVTITSKVELALSEAVPCGLIVNELLTNCLKHSFPGGRSGTISLSLSCDAGECRLEVADDGVGLPAKFRLDETTSVGLKLVSVLAKQLGGYIRLEPGVGTCVTVVFPQSERERQVQQI